jgi:hypothetical protein
VELFEQIRRDRDVEGLSIAGDADLLGSVDLHRAQAATGTVGRSGRRGQHHENDPHDGGEQHPHDDPQPIPRVVLTEVHDSYYAAVVGIEVPTLAIAVVLRDAQDRTHTSTLVADAPRTRERRIRVDRRPVRNVMKEGLPAGD